MAYYAIGTPIPEWASAWAKRDNCTDGPSTVFQQGQVTGQAWAGCDGGVQVLLYTIQDGGHGWPGGEFDATRHIWDFFSRDVSK
jgi:poly(3-hydroxybutyrate) depolymerase